MLSNFQFHHIGVVVKSIVQTSSVYMKGGYEASNIILDPIQNVNIRWLRKAKMPTVELLEPVGENSPVCSFLEKNGVAPYHICYVVENIEKAVSDLRSMKYVLVSKPVAAVAIQNSRVCFLYNKNVGLIEIVEEPAQITE